MSSTGYGERLTDNAGAPNVGRVYLSPPAASAWEAAGRPLDAGTAMIRQSNLFHEQYESVRPLAHVLGDGAIIHQGADGWDGLSDGTRPNPSDPAAAVNGANGISWSQAQSMRFGPYFIPQDVPDTVNAGQYLLRAIRFDVQVISASGTLRLYFATTGTAATPDLGFIDYLAPAVPGTGHVTATLAAVAPQTPSTLWTCRPNPTGGGAPIASQSSQPTAVWCWVGYKGGAVDAILAASLWEVRL